MDFDTAAERVKQLVKQPSQNDMLSLYSLFKQAKEGDAPAKGPSRLQIRDHAKWKAWDSLRGLSNDEACTRYVALVERLINEIGL